MKDDEIVVRLAQKAKHPGNASGDSADDEVSEDIDRNKTDELDKVLDSAVGDILAATREEDEEKAEQQLKGALLDFVHAATRGKVL